MANERQFTKEIHSDSHQDCPVRIVYYENDPFSAFDLALADIAAERGDASVLLLYRNHSGLPRFLSERFSKGHARQGNELCYRPFPSLRIRHSTVHASKGLESDYAILLSGERGITGFPSQVPGDPVLRLFLSEKEDYPDAEERRLFYVALTRARFVVYLLSEKSLASPFIKEIEGRAKVLHDVTKTTEDRLCPRCRSGHLIKRTSPLNDKPFYGCSNYPYCTYTNNSLEAVQEGIRCPFCGDYLVLDRDLGNEALYRCSNHACIASRRKLRLKRPQ